MVAAAAIGAGANLASSALSLYGASLQNKAAKRAAQKQMDFQREMYSTRYQMQMTDMRKAGLNPILSYKTGAPGGPAGASYSPVNVGAAAGPGIQQAVTTALAAKRQSEELQNMRAQRRLVETQIKAQAGNVAGAKNAARAYSGDRGYLYWLLNNSKGSTVSRAAGALIAPPRSAKPSRAPQYGPRSKSTSSSSKGRHRRQHNFFGSWMRKTRRKVYGPKRRSPRSRRYDFQKGGLPK